MGLLLKPFSGVLVNAAVLFALLFFVPEITYTGGIKFFVLGGIILGLINLIIKPILKAVSLPLVFLTGGLFLIVINAGVLWFLSYFFEILAFQDVTLVFPNLGSYVIGAVVFGIANWALNFLTD